MRESTFTIKEAAARAGVSPDTIRHYERVGVLPRAPRTDAGYRRYSDAALAQVAVVRNAVRFGFSLKELARFFEARAKGRPPCASVRAAGERILGEMDRQIVELTQARSTMARLLGEWDARLAGTPSGMPAHLLSTLPEMPPGRVRRPAAPRRHGSS